MRSDEAFSMNERDMLQDLVVLFDAAGAAVQQELSVAHFERLRQRTERLPERAGETVRAAYVLVEPGLRVGGLVFFLIPVDASGAVAESFNVPLEYLVEFAGVRSDLGIGAIPVASRAQCPVPWMALNLWEPDATEEGPARVVQRAVLLNRMGLSSNPVSLRVRLDAAVEPARSQRAAGTRAAQPARPPAGSAAAVDAQSDGGATLPRDATGAIEQAYLEQIRKFRLEVLELKAVLRVERERNRRLQALLRGAV